MTARGDDLTLDDPYYTLASTLAADLPKLVLKDDEAFLVADQRGDFPGVRGGEFGFYVDGTRFLHHLDLRVQRTRPLVLNAALSSDALQIAVDLTNPDIQEGNRVVLAGRTLRIARLVTLHQQRLHVVIRIETFAATPHPLTVAWHFAADFTDVFEVRGFRRERHGAAMPPVVGERDVALGYRGLDGVTRTTRVAFDPAPAELSDRTATYELELVPGRELTLALAVAAELDQQTAGRAPSFGEAMTRRRERIDLLARDAAVPLSDHQQFNEWVDRSRTDLHMLLTQTPDGFVPYAGIPWYVAPFGRDSLITALQVLPFEPAIARGTLQFLARHQGTADDPFTDQEPGKILHEYRRGELANCREIPFVPYYGSVDATALFVVLAGDYVRWTGDLELARTLWPSVERALAWIEGPGSPGGDGYLKYAQRSPTGLLNQGWKDSRDAIMHASGDMPEAPIALAEAQGYKYAALLRAAELAEGVIGRPELGHDLRRRAWRLRDHFERDFWMEDEGFYALALDGDGRPCKVISSNPGHCLWTGIVSEARTEFVAKRLMMDDMFSGWGIRTLSARERLYNPMSYHNGSVWPHDTAIAALGIRRVGLLEPFLALTTALFQAALHWDGMRVPELFCGFSRRPEYGPTRYPVACSPQAWAAGVVFELIHGMLGFAPDARRNQLTLDRPVIPSWLSWIEIRGLRFRHSRLSLVVERGRQGPAVELLDREGDAEVLIRR